MLNVKCDFAGDIDNVVVLTIKDTTDAQAVQKIYSHCKDEKYFGPWNLIPINEEDQRHYILHVLKQNFTNLANIHCNAKSRYLVEQIHR